MPATYTPIRYPGGKTKLYPLVKSIIDENDMAGCVYCEAFAGGAGLAMKLLLKGDVSSVVINDLDRAVYCMWDAIVNHPDEMCEFVKNTPLCISEWEYHRERYKNPSGASNLELAKSAFYLNRTNVSGILEGGIIGGINQDGPYKMDARFNRDGLVNKIRAISQRAADISIHNLDAEDFIENALPQGRVKVLIYLDPPYVKKGPGLYKSSFDEDKHRSLAKRIKRSKRKWIVTYDSDPLIDEIYKTRVAGEMEIGYSAYSASIGREKLIISPNLSIPDNALSA
ncbi:MAG: DNA adenine methylase [Eggerthellaceae bacterium]|nr:DNA adenine methylase [Eggerthellaceae bacterium]